MTIGRMPEFIIGGAPRSGTTWLYELLDNHPDIYMAKPVKPEPKFFLDDRIYEKGLACYAHWFADAKPGQIAGEKSTNYLESAVCAQRIRSNLPNVKLIFILRDPVERAYSNYLWSRMNGLETQEFVTALSLESQREQELPSHLRFARPYSYYSRGLYAALLAPWFELFPAEQIQCLRFEDIQFCAEELTGVLHRFLGVEERPDDASDLGKINAAEKAEGGIPLRAKSLLAAAYAEPNLLLADLLGPDFKIWKYDE